MDKTKMKLLDKLGKKGFDTEKKVNAIDMQVAFDNGLADEIGGVLALQKAIKTHNVYSFHIHSLWMALTQNRKRRRQSMIEMIEDQETIQNHTVIEINDLDELKNLINSLPEGTVYSLNLEVVELGQET